MVAVLNRLLASPSGMQHSGSFLLQAKWTSNPFPGSVENLSMTKSVARSQSCSAHKDWGVVIDNRDLSEELRVQTGKSIAMAASQLS